jgi:hypothetical protein
MGPLASRQAACWLASLLFLVACEERVRPWEGKPDGAVVDESEPFLPGRRQGPLLGDASFAEPQEAGIDAGAAKPVSRVGGMWVSCYGRFQPSGRPAADVTRLGLLCGPSNGMTKLGRTLRGQLAKGSNAPRTHPMKARAGGCYRIFAVAGGDVKNLNLVIRSSRGSRLAGDDSEDNWPIIDPERPFCSFDDGTFRIEVTSAGGAGPYAIEIWQLPPR